MKRHVRYPEEIPLLEEIYALIVGAAQDHSRDEEVTIPTIDKYECLLVGEVT